MYGLEDFLPSYPGYSQQLIFKYFLGKNESALGTNDKFLVCSKKLVVVKTKDDYSFKVSVVPKYNDTTSMVFKILLIYR